MLLELERGTSPLLPPRRFHFLLPQPLPILWAPWPVGGILDGERMSACRVAL